MRPPFARHSHETVLFLGGMTCVRLHGRSRKPSGWPPSSAGGIDLRLPTDAGPGRLAADHQGTSGYQKVILAHSCSSAFDTDGAVLENSCRRWTALLQRTRHPTPG